MRERSFGTGLVIGVLGAAVIGLAIALFLVSGDDGDDEPTTTTEVVTTAPETTTTTPTGGTESCEPPPGPLSNNIFDIEATGTSCDEAQAVIDNWLRQGCGAEPEGTPCEISGGYSCVIEGSSGAEGVSVSCRGADATVTFSTGS